jgi:hypothetical protein
MFDALFGSKPKPKPKPIVTETAVPSGVLKLRSKAEVSAILYRAGHADEILLVVGQQIPARLLPSGIIEFVHDYRSPLSNKSIAPGQWLVKASLTDGGIAGDGDFRVWWDKDVRAFFEVPELETEDV